MTVANKEREQMSEVGPYFRANQPSVIDPSRLDYMDAMESDWDSYGAAPPSEAAMKALRRLCLVPTNEGGWTLTVYESGTAEAEVEVNAEGSIQSVSWTKD